jgi:acyl-homoserine-lactone acylase
MSIGWVSPGRVATRLLAGALVALALGCAANAAPASAAPPGWQTAIAPHGAEYRRLQREARQVTITRDTWGIPHVHGKTDADAVFGALYAQCEDDFSRVERNWLVALGWSAQADGPDAIAADLREQLFVDPAVLKRDYARSPAWLRQLMQAWADGINWYLATHPEVRPKVIRHYEPWMALSFTDGNAGSDVEMYVGLDQVARFYGIGGEPRTASRDGTPPTWAGGGGSNGIAIAPKLTADGHALLLINPHVTYYSRAELQMTSDAGLDAYGAATWGQLFVYQGFNRHVGWMHTSSGVDEVDRFAETVEKRDGKYVYRFGKQWKPVTTRDIAIAYRGADGALEARTFTTYATRHGPITAAENGKWIATAMMHRPVEGLEQSWLRTKSSDLAGYLTVAELKANDTNNTVFADDKGEIALLMPQFIARRDNRFDYLKPVDGSNPATVWRGMTPLADMPNVINPPNGWVMNTNNWPYSAAGKHSPRRAGYPQYMDSFGENARGEHATRLLTGASGFTKAKLIADAYDPYLPAFARLLPILVRDYDGLPQTAPMKAKLAGPIAVLRAWNDRWGSASIATTLAVAWGDTLWNAVAEQAVASGADAHTTNLQVLDYIAGEATPTARLGALATAVDTLDADFGHWGVPWGDFNRYQRPDDAPDAHFDDAKPSLAIPFTASRWGSLAAANSHRWPGTKKYYSNMGNSFVAVVEFGPRVSARAVHVGGQSGHPDSPHFTDQADRYVTGDLRTVYFWPDQLHRHTVRVYHPGQ